MSSEITSFYGDIRAIIEQARQAAYSAVNSAMVAAYWQIGRRIVEEEQGGAKRAEYGQGLLKNLSTQLTKEFDSGFMLPTLSIFAYSIPVTPISPQIKNPTHCVGN